MALDPRLAAFRPDLADHSLKDQVRADRYSEGSAARLVVPVADLRTEPSHASPIGSQLLFGEAMSVFDRAEGWAWVQSASDSYVGYVPEPALSPDAAEPTHHVVAPRSFAYGEPELRSRPTRVLSIGSAVRVDGWEERRGNRYAVLETGEALVARHVAPIGEEDGRDWVAVAELFEHTPYLWGGRSGFGIDCSALVQLSLAMAGRPAPRDSDMQADRLGEALSEGDMLSRGDLVFWTGHVGIMLDGETMLHASGRDMLVVRESVAAAVERIRPLYGPPTVRRRIAA